MTKRVALVAIAALIGGLVGARAYAADTKHDAMLRSGEHTARTMCSACHVVAADQEIPPLLKPPAPSFADLANRPDTSVASVRRFVLEAHYDMKTLPAGMPNLMLTKDEATAVARYLLSLRRH